MDDTLDDGDCRHGMLPGTCAYCSGSYRREQDAIAREQRMMIARVNGARAAADAAWGTVTIRGWTRAISAS